MGYCHANPLRIVQLTSTNNSPNNRIYFILPKLIWNDSHIDLNVNVYCNSSKLWKIASLYNVQCTTYIVHSWCSTESVLCFKNAVTLPCYVLIQCTLWSNMLVQFNGTYFVVHDKWYVLDIAVFWENASHIRFRCSVAQSKYTNAAGFLRFCLDSNCDW